MAAGDVAGLTALPPVAAPFPISAPHRVAPNLRPLDGAPAVVLDAAYPAALDRAVQRLATEPARVRVRDPVAADDAGLAAALKAWFDLLAAQVPAAVTRDRDAVSLPLLGLVLAAAGPESRAEAVGEPHPALGRSGRSARDLLLRRRGLDLLADAARLAVSDDLVVLRRDGPGRMRVELFLVAFPSSWAPIERAGQDHAALHAPVGDNRRLLAAGSALTEALLTKGPFVQHAWGVAPDGRLDDDPGARPRPLPDDPAPEDCHLRVERQTSQPLPTLGRALFTIRLFLTPLRRVAADPGRAAVLAEALATMGPASLAYKRLERLRDPLVTWLREAARRSPSTPGP